MANDTEQLYAERLKRYTTAMQNGKPDKIPIRPFVAEFTATYAGYTCQEVTHDYTKAFDAARKCATDFDWDAVVANMVYGWSGLTEAISLDYYAVPGIHIEPDVGFQYLEPPEEQAFMPPEEYDELIEDPTGYLYRVWMPRIARDVVAMGKPATYRNNLSFVKGGMAMLQYFMAFGPQAEALKNECGTVSAIAGILKAPMDILADKLRGYLGLCTDLMERPEKVLAACEALAPHLAHIAIGTSDPSGTVPVGYWMHRGCVPFVSMDHFNDIYWPTLKPIVEAIWASGHQTLFYAEGSWDAHLESFAELPDRSIVYHVDQGDMKRVHEALGKKFCLCGGVPNYLLGIGKPDQVREACKEVIDIAAADGGYIMDAAAIVQNDAKVENMRAMTDFTREYGVYGDSCEEVDTTGDDAFQPTTSLKDLPIRPGVCLPWEDKLKDLPELTGDAGLVKRIWEDTDALAYMYVWQCLLSF